jgi:hypothetical protein
MKKFLRFFLLLIASSMMMAQLNAQTILCVDRDFGSSPDSNYTDTWYFIKKGLDAAGYTYEHWEVVEDDDPSPDAEYMGNFDVVIWITGEAYTGQVTMGDGDEFELSLYLSLGGGNLFLNAQDWLYDWYPNAGTFGPGDFAHDVLGLQEVFQDKYHIEPEDPNQWADSAMWYGSPGSLAEGLAFTTKDIFTTPDDDGLYADSIVEHMGQDLFALSWPYNSPGTPAIQYDAGSYRAVFSTLDVAAITDSTIRNIMIHRIVDWLEFGPTGVNEVKAKEAELLISPNPVKDYANIGMLYIMDELSIFNNQGKLVRHEEVGRNSTKLDLSDLPTGMYVLQVKSTEGITTSKLIKQ